MNTTMRKMPIGIQNFEKLRKENYLYVDKTALVYRLAQAGNPCFLSRPRRFGKSLLLSTFEAYYEGKRELFEGLAIERLETEWNVHPVMHFDLNARNYETMEDLLAMLNQHLEKWEALYGNEKQDRAPEERFAYIIEQACVKTGRRVVVLIDEYDKPLLRSFHDETLQRRFRNLLTAFYTVLKSADRYLRFVFITGVTKFAQMSVFSELNQLSDISMDYAYTALCGMTDSEIEKNFAPELQELAATTRLTYEQTKQKLTELYDGYHFTQNVNDAGIYNPFSVLSALSKQRFDKYPPDHGKRKVISGPSVDPSGSGPLGRYEPYPAFINPEPADRNELQPLAFHLPGESPDRRLDNHPELNTRDLYENAGFPSRTSFFRQFKEITGKTLGDFFEEREALPAPTDKQNRIQ